MPLEIREMIVRTTLTGPSDEAAEKAMANHRAFAEPDIEYIIERCIERIAEMIREENEK